MVYNNSDKEYYTYGRLQFYLSTPLVRKERIMKQIIIVTETGADLSSEEIHKYNIQVVAMHVVMEEESLNDGEFETSLIFDYYDKNKKIPSTSATNPNEYANIFEKIHTQYPDALILHLCYSAITTATWQNAHIASDGLEYVYHVDTKGVSALLGGIVIEVAKYIANHPLASIHEVMERANEIIANGRMAFLPKNLVYLKAGGRVSNAAYLGATLLKLRPVIEIIDGTLVCTQKFRGSMKLAIKKLVEEYLEKYTFQPDTLFIITGFDLDLESKEMAIALVKEHGYSSIRFVNPGCVISTHSGPGSFGIGGIIKSEV